MSSSVRASTTSGRSVRSDLSLVSYAPEMTMTLRTGAKMIFIVLRHRFCTIQGVLREEPEKVSQLMIRWARSITRESIVIVDGVIQRPPPKQAEVRGTTIRQFEIKIRRVRPFRCITCVSSGPNVCAREQLFVVAAPSDKLPFQVRDVSRPKKCYEKARPPPSRALLTPLMTIV